MNNYKQLPRLMIFTIVAQKGSFTDTAKYLNISKSAVSQQIATLEADFGVRLLNRTTRKLSLTPAGDRLFERCNVLKDQLALIFNDLEELGASPKGRFAVTYPYSLESTVVLPAIEQICIEYPNLEPVLMADDTTLDLITNQIDVAIHIGELPDSGYRALPIGSLTELFCTTPLYLNKHGNISSTEELCRHRWISTSWQRSNTKVTCVKTRVSKNIMLNEFAKSNSLPAAIGMTLKHLGIALIPDVIATPLIQSGSLVHIAKHLRGPEWPVYSVHAYQAEKPIHITRLHQLICQKFNEIQHQPKIQ